MLSDESSGSGVVVLVELERSDSKELILPHVSEDLDEDEEDGPDDRTPGVNGFDLDRALNGVCMKVGVLGAVLVGENVVVTVLVGDEGALSLVGEGGTSRVVGWYVVLAFEEVYVDSSMR